MAAIGDGWGAPYDDQTYVNAYDQLELAILEPLDRELKQADIEVFRPKFKFHLNPKNRKNKKTDDEEYLDAIYNLPSTDESDSDHEQKKIYFQPPLQVQRNSFVKNTLMKFKRETQDIRRLAVMGCGEMSLERGMCEYLGALGTINVISVDIDETSLSVGQQLLQKHITRQSEILATETGLPVLFRSYVGDILVPDHRFADTDAIVSMEVVEHIPLDDARKFVANVLGVLMPRIFIFSTPNHEYNAVFGMKPGEFRHDDHKFEMSSQEFAAWLEELSARFPHYQIDAPHYIGMTRGHESLNGASQAAVCRLIDNLNSQLPQDTLPYEVVGQIPCRLGSRLVAYNLVRQAFLEWITKIEFHEAELKKEGILVYYLYDVRHVLHHLHAPISFASTIDEKVAINYIMGMTSHKVDGEFTHGFNGIAIQKHFTKEEIIQAVRKNELK
ncbi:unnamed protein product [Caenorhabditis sp. 36 PRJEB53466]|nr:unnamed protein product [Caenorhabditis sp. 36 PRJEB53466]